MDLFLAHILTGTMMRASPMWSSEPASYDLSQVSEWACQDAALTHLNPVCLKANALITMTIAHAIKAGADPESLYHSHTTRTERFSAKVATGMTDVYDT